jgi:hypothetical protein
LLISYSLFPIKFSPKMRDLSTKKLWEGQNWSKLTQLRPSLN